MIAKSKGNFSLIIGYLLVLFGFLLFPILSWAQNNDSLLRRLEKQQFENSPEQLLPQLQQVDEALLNRKITFSLPENIRFAAIKMAYFNSNGEGEKGLLLADSLQNIPEYKTLPEEAWASIYFQKGDIYLYQEKMLESSRNYARAIQLYELQAKPNFSELALCHNNLGYVQDILGFQNRSKQSYYRAFEIWKTSHLDEFSNISTVLNNLIFAEIEYGNYTAAEELLAFFQRYVTETKKSFGLSEIEELDLEMKLLLNFSRFYGATKNDRQLDRILIQAEAIIRHAPRDFFEEQWGVMAAIYEEAGFLQKEMKNFQAAVGYYERMKSLPLSGFFQMKYLANQAIVYYDAGENQKSLDYAQKSLSLLERYGFGGSSGFSLQVLQADLLNRLGEEGKSMEMLEKMLSDLLQKPIKRKGIAELTYSDFKQLNNERYLTILIKSGQILMRMGKKNSNLQDLSSSLNLFQVAGEMFQEYYLKGSYTQSLEEINKQIQEGIFSLWNVNGLLTSEKKIRLLELLERNDSQQGWKKFLSKNEEFLGSTSEFLKELNLKTIELNQGQLSQGREKSLREELHQIEKRIQEEEAYRFYNRPFDILSFQRDLPPNLSVLKYLVTEKQIFALLIHQNDLQVYSLAPVEMVNSWVEEFRNSMVRLDDSYRSPAATLYRLLVSPFAESLREEIYILPDDRLHGIPFEALIDEKGDFLVQNHFMSYQQSFREMAYESPKNDRFGADFLVAFAPDYQGTGYQAIKNNLEEVVNLTGLVEGKAMIGQHANKTAFINSLTDYQIHHLAMHAEQNPVNYEESALIFSGGDKLLLRDLYQVNFPSELVVLSACQTGMGKLMPGEGLMSLSKALNLAGVKSTVYSLWAIPDKETAEVMLNFYRGIKAGKPKHIALIHAKRQFIQENPLKNHPLFWSGFVLNGKTDPLSSSWWSKEAKFAMVFGCLGLVLGWIIFLRKSRKRPGSL